MWLIRFNNLRKLLRKKYKSAHIELSRNVKASMKYCMKEETRVGGPWEFGTKPPGSGGDYKSLKIKDLKSFNQSGITRSFIG